MDIFPHNAKYDGHTHPLSHWSLQPCTTYACNSNKIAPKTFTYVYVTLHTFLHALFTTLPTFTYQSTWHTCTQILSMIKDSPPYELLRGGRYAILTSANKSWPDNWLHMKRRKHQDKLLSNITTSCHAEQLQLKLCTYKDSNVPLQSWYRKEMIYTLCRTYALRMRTVCTLPYCTSCTTNSLK